MLERPGGRSGSKNLIALVARRPVDDALIAETASRIARIRVSGEGREGLAGFLEKRKPGWDKTRGVNFIHRLGLGKTMFHFPHRVRRIRVRD